MHMCSLCRCTCAYTGIHVELKIKEVFNVRVKEMIKLEIYYLVTLKKTVQADCSVKARTRYAVYCLILQIFLCKLQLQRKRR